MAAKWSGERVSNPRHSAWKADALPIELSPRKKTGAGGRIRTFEDLRRQIYSLLPLAARAPLHMNLLWSWRWESNPQPPDYKSGALPIELRQHDTENS